jgi:hypothetical protein
MDRQLASRMEMAEDGGCAVAGFYGTVTGIVWARAVTNICVCASYAEGSKLIHPILCPDMCICVCVYMYVCMYDVSLERGVMNCVI